MPKRRISQSQDTDPMTPLQRYDAQIQQRVDLTIVEEKRKAEEREALSRLDSMPAPGYYLKRPEELARVRREREEERGAAASLEETVTNALKARGRKLMHGSRKFPNDTRPESGARDLDRAVEEYDKVMFEAATALKIVGKHTEKTMRLLESIFNSIAYPENTDKTPSPALLHAATKAVELELDVIVPGWRERAE